MDIYVISFAQISFAVLATLGLLYVERTKDRQERYERHKALKEEASMKHIEQDTTAQNSLFFTPLFVFTISIVFFIWSPSHINSTLGRGIITVLLIYSIAALYFFAIYPYDRKGIQWYIVLIMTPLTIFKFKLLKCKKESNNN